MFFVFAFFAIFVQYRNRIWAVQLLFVVTVIVAAAAGELLL
jgi:hypothetical protein